MRRDFLSLLAAACLLLAGSAAGCAEQPRSVNLTILHTNDTHGHLLPYSYPETFDSNSDLARLPTRANIGGAARRATLVKKIRREPNREVLLIDAGDLCDGTPFSTEYHGDADIAAMNAIGYDLACPGNHEYSNTLPQVRKLIADAKFPLISANTRVKADGKPLFTPYIIKEIGGAKVAFFGLMTYSARTYPAARDELQMQEPIAAARNLVPELRKKADLIVAVTHIGVNEDRQLATAVDGIDVIVGGHSHTMLPAPLFIGAPPSSNRHSVNGTVIVQDFQWGGTLGRLDLNLYRDERGRWAVRRYTGKLLPITNKIPEDPEVAAVVDRFWKPISAKYGAVIGEALGDFTLKGSDRAEYNLVADAVREQLNLEFDLENLGGVRSPIVKGAITYGDLVTLDPFGNTIVTFRATGRQLKQILARHRPAVSGIRYVLEGSRLVEATIGGQPIVEERVYSGATNSYWAPFILGDVTDKTDTRKPRLDSVIAYIRKKGAIQPAYDGRRVIREIGDFD